MLLRRAEEEESGVGWSALAVTVGARVEKIMVGERTGGEDGEGSVIVGRIGRVIDRLFFFVKVFFGRG